MVKVIWTWSWHGCNRYLEKSNEEVSGLDSTGNLILKELLGIQMLPSCVVVVN